MKANRVLRDRLEAHKDWNFYVLGATGYVGSDVVKRILDASPQTLLFGSSRDKIMRLDSKDDISKIYDSGVGLGEVGSHMCGNNCIVIDCSSGSGKFFEDVHLNTINSGGIVVTANKNPLVETEDPAYMITHAHYHGDVTVGAGNFGLKQMRQFREWGVSPIVYAVGSGTLVHNENLVINENWTYENATFDAIDVGKAETDPRVDLSGCDVEKKAKIMLYQYGYNRDEIRGVLSPHIGLETIIFEDGEFRGLREEPVLDKDSIYVARIDLSSGSYVVDFVDNIPVAQRNMMREAGGGMYVPEEEMFIAAPGAGKHTANNMITYLVEALRED